VEPSFREALSDFVDRLDGFVVVGGASDGESGVAMALRLRPAVVLLDLRMPGIDGLEAARRLKTLPVPPAVVMVTSFTETRFRQEAMGAGADAYVVKHCVSDELEGILRRLRPPPLKGRSSTASSPAG
jgi:DNA-binding NarL/FixJ family response regulator